MADENPPPRDYVQAAGELALAGRTLPSDPRVPELTGYMLRRQGHWDESARSLERALDLDPRNFTVLVQLSSSYLDLHRHADEERVLQRALPPSSGLRWFRLSTGGRDGRPAHWE